MQDLTRHTPFQEAMKHSVMNGMLFTGFTPKGRGALGVAVLPRTLRWKVRAVPGHLRQVSWKSLHPERPLPGREDVHSHLSVCPGSYLFHVVMLLLLFRRLVFVLVWLCLFVFDVF